MHCAVDDVEILTANGGRWHSTTVANLLERHKFGNSDLTVSRVGLGYYGMSGAYGGGRRAVNRHLSAAQRNICHTAGFRFQRPSLN
jgi:hypothetical protein